MSGIKIRQSQIITTFGPGALVDLPRRAVLVAGLDHWVGEAKLISEPRLLANLRQRLEKPNLELRAPPVPKGADDFTVGIAAWEFPEWFVAQYEEKSEKFGRSRPLVHRENLIKGEYQANEPSGKRKRKSWPVVPVRFVQACPNGHVSDIEWSRLVHGPGVSCGGQLWLDEHGTTGDLSELFLRCDGCDKPQVQLIRLQRKGEELLGDCQGQRLWLGPNARETCAGLGGKPHRNKLLIRHASNAYFPVIERAISIPDAGEDLRKAVDAVWDDFLSVAEGPADIKRERKKARVQQALEKFSDAEVWAECERRRGGGGDTPRMLKDVELDSFLAQADEMGDDKPFGDFYARRLPIKEKPSGPMQHIERVVLVHRLREVVTEIGFTRFESPVAAVDDEVDLNVSVAPLAQEANWLPAVENRGEGIFLALDPQRMKNWIDRVKQRAKAFHEGIQRALRRNDNPIPIYHIERIYLPYLMLHSLSHLLLTAIALECGYAAASIRERIYVRDGAYGILLYTGTPDAEGTLGGLVQVGRRMSRHLETALELGRLCSNDPVCAQHRPNQRHEDRHTHGAACHGCLLIAEPSCERRNEFLDRSLVVPTVDVEDAAYFGDWS